MTANWTNRTLFHGDNLKFMRGLNHVTNRILLCGPCNRLKSNTFTLSGLRRENKKRGYMSNA